MSSSDPHYVGGQMDSQEFKYWVQVNSVNKNSAAVVVVVSSNPTEFL
jgi:hypothetical protein